ncbi:TIGR03086 family metal-binding protein [Saccharothrix obliqua]|uniref:TIGR03086 family metal-binding protein n=1 Tax=Saccharothrix obliqua TaxID=2861747 RepID=UPI001C5F1EEC|nr:TIGR03086 family metal-binding protein [Saccharothrix obliqua]MBW4719722.1 TIGR03086 family protein [Saccharothrix obliqua]
MDLLDLDRAAVDRNLELLATLEPGHYDLPTPCAGWTVRDLVRHLADMAVAFDAGARLAAPRATVTADLRASYAAANELVTEAFHAEGFLDREAELPGFGAYPGRSLVAAHFVDNVVHSWDLNRALGRDAEVPAEFALAAHEIAARYPDTPAVRGPGAAFAPEVAARADATPTDRLVALLGRTPDWRP